MSAPAWLGADQGRAGLISYMHTCTPVYCIKSKSMSLPKVQDGDTVVDSTDATWADDLAVPTGADDPETLLAEIVLTGPQLL